MSKLTYRIIVLRTVCDVCHYPDRYWVVLLWRRCLGDAVIPGVDPEMWQPAQTDALLYLMYVLFGLAIAATVIAAVFQFGAALKDNPANAIKSLLGLVLLVVVLL